MRSRTFFHKVVENIKRPEMRVLPGQLAFFFVISLIPIIALVGAIASYLSVSTTSLTNTLEGVLPHSIMAIILPIMNGEGLNFNMTIFFISAFLLASNGAHSMIIASNTIYKIKDDDYIRRRIKAILMTVILVSLIFFLLLVPAFGNFIIQVIKESVSNQNLANSIEKIYLILEYPVSLFLIYFNIKLLYTIAPDAPIKSYTTTVGAFFTTVSWLIATKIYAIYVEKFTHYDIFYGSISNILVLLLWVYILAYIFTLGMSFNASHTENLQRDEKK